MKAAKERDMEMIRYIESRFPTLFLDTNAAGLLPYEEYLAQGGQDHGVYMSLMPAYEPSWNVPAWYGKPEAWKNASW